MKKKYLPILRKRNAESLLSCIDDLKKSWEDLDKFTKITENWRELIGTELFKECKPLKIEKKILVIAVNNPQWRQALIYNKHKLKERIYEIGIQLSEIKIIQNYELKKSNRNSLNAKFILNQHPSRVNKYNLMDICKLCNCPTPRGEIDRWGKCTFCWRKNL